MYVLCTVYLIGVGVGVGVGDAMISVLTDADQSKVLASKASLAQLQDEKFALEFYTWGGVCTLYLSVSDRMNETLSLSHALTC